MPHSVADTNSCSPLSTAQTTMFHWAVLRRARRQLRVASAEPKDLDDIPLQTRNDNSPNTDESSRPHISTEYDPISTPNERNQNSLKSHSPQMPPSQHHDGRSTRPTWRISGPGLIGSAMAIADIVIILLRLDGEQQPEWSRMLILILLSPGNIGDTCPC